MNAAVRRRLPNNSPAALYLSGGLGSTAIAAAARTLKRKLPSYTTAKSMHDVIAVGIGILLFAGVLWGHGFLFGVAPTF